MPLAAAGARSDDGEASAAGSDATPASLVTAGAAPGEHTLAAEAAEASPAGLGTSRDGRDAEAENAVDGTALLGEAPAEAPPSAAGSSPGAPPHKSPSLRGGDARDGTGTEELAHPHGDAPGGGGSGEAADLGARLDVLEEQPADDALLEAEPAAADASPLDEVDDVTTPCSGPDNPAAGDAAPAAAMDEADPLPAAADGPAADDMAAPAVVPPVAVALVVENPNLVTATEHVCRGEAPDDGGVAAPAKEEAALSDAAAPNPAAPHISASGESDRAGVGSEAGLHDADVEEGRSQASEPAHEPAFLPPFANAENKAISKQVLVRAQPQSITLLGVS